MAGTGPGTAAADRARYQSLHDHVRAGGRGGRVAGDQGSGPVIGGQLTEAVTAGSFGLLVDVVAAGNAVILSGAGLSTESGIPDYRGPTGLARRATPMTYQTFTAQVAARRRYWARSHLGWQHIGQAAPNHGHHAVAELGRRGLLAGIITQNVDGLHQAAGPVMGTVLGGAEVTELHGSLHRVICL